MSNKQSVLLCICLFRYALLCVHSSFAIILKRKRKLLALLLLTYRCFVTNNVQWLCLTMSWVCLQYLIVIFPDHTHLLLGHKLQFTTKNINIALHDTLLLCCINLNTTVSIA